MLEKWTVGERKRLRQPWGNQREMAEREKAVLASVRTICVEDDAFGDNGGKEDGGR